MSNAMDDFDVIETANDEWDETLEITSKVTSKQASLILKLSCVILT